MKIARLEAVPLAAEFAELYGGVDHIPPWISRPAAHFQAVPRSGQYSTLVSLETDDGRLGYGEAWGLPLPEVTALIVNRILAPMFMGQPLAQAERIAAQAHDYLWNLGYTRGATLEALSGVDIALWDLRARLQNRTLADLLGGARRQSIACYASPVMFKSVPAESEQAAMDFIDGGYRAIKIKAGRGVDTDLEHIAAVRGAVGEDIDLMVDVNGGYDADTAIELARRAAPLDIKWLEEPVPCGRNEDLRRIKQETGVTIACGENDFTEDDFRALIVEGQVDVVMPNVTRAGGITGTMAIARLAAEHGAGFSMHGVGSALMQCASIHVLSVLDNAEPFEVNTFPNPLRDRIAIPAPRLEEGMLCLPTGAGLGCMVDEEAVLGFRAVS